MFSSLPAFTRDEPRSYSVGLDRRSPTMQPDYDREYGYKQYFFFVDDSYRPARRLTVNGGNSGVGRRSI